MEEVLGKTITEIRPGETSEALEARDREIIETDSPFNNKVDFDKSLMGDRRWVLTSKVPLHGTKGEVDGVVGMTLDITDQKEAEEEARQANELLQKKMNNWKLSCLWPGNCRRRLCPWVL